MAYKKSREEIEAGNEKVMSVMITLLIVILIVIILPVFFFSLFTLIPLSFVSKNIRRILMILSLLVFGYFVYTDPALLFGYYGTLQNSINLNIGWIDSLLIFLFDDIPVANFFTFISYIIGSIIIASIFIEYKNYKKSLRIDTEENKRNKYYDSDKYKNVYKNRLKRNHQLQKKWRKKDDDNLLIGIDEYGNPSYMKFEELNQHAFVSATTGGGKTVLLMGIIEHASKKGYPMMFIDGKGSATTIDDFKQINEMYDREVIVFGDDYNVTYNPLKYGNSEVIVDKLKQLVETESVFYSNTNEILIQNVIMFMDDYGLTRDLRTFAYYLQSDNVKEVLENDVSTKTVKRTVENKSKKDNDLLDFALDDSDNDETENEYEEEIVKELSERAKKYYNRFFKAYKDTKDGENYLFINGSSVKSEILKIVDSDLGHLFEETDNSIDLIEASKNNQSIFISFDGTQYENFIKKTARFLILDANILVSQRNRKIEGIGNDPFLVIYDEFSVYANRKIIDTINKSREAGFHAVISTQTIHDLNEVDSTFADIVIANTNNVFVGQTNEDSEVDMWSKTFGTYKDAEITNVTELGTKSKIHRKEERGDRGTARDVQKFRIEPQQIRDLSMGEFVMQRKSSKVDKGQSKPKPQIVYARNPLDK